MSGDLNWNKVFGASLGTALAIMLVQEVSSVIYPTKVPETMGYLVNVPEEAAAGAAEVELAPDWGTLIPVADLAAGEAAFARCVACHTMNVGGANGIGPNLNGVIGRAMASHGGFAYSDAMVAHASVDPTWSLDAMDQFIKAPARYVDGTKMSFAGLRDVTARTNLIAWMRSQGSEAYPVPAPDPTRQPGGGAPADSAPVEGAPVEGTPADVAASPDATATAAVTPAG